MREEKKTTGVNINQDAVENAEREFQEADLDQVAGGVSGDLCNIIVPD